MIPADAVFRRLTHRKRTATSMETVFIFIFFHLLYLENVISPPYRLLLRNLISWAIIVYLAWVFPQNFGMMETGR